MLVFTWADFLYSYTYWYLPGAGSLYCYTYWYLPGAGSLYCYTYWYLPGAGSLYCYTYWYLPGAGSLYCYTYWYLPGQIFYTSTHTGIYLGQVLYKAVDVGTAGGGDDLVHSHLPAVVPIGDVVPDTGIKQDWLLGYYTKVRPQPSHVQFFDRTTVHRLK